jgi:hypothetical protein
MMHRDDHSKQCFQISARLTGRPTDHYVTVFKAKVEVEIRIEIQNSVSNMLVGIFPPALCLSLS